MEHRPVKTLNAFSGTVCTGTDEHVNPLPLTHVCAGVEHTCFERSWLILDLNKVAGPSNKSLRLLHCCHVQPNVIQTGDAYSFSTGIVVIQGFQRSYTPFTRCCV